MTFFHVHRSEALLDGRGLGLIRWAEPHVVFPEGVSRWGRQHLITGWESSEQPEMNDLLVELALEVVRRQSYPSKPSRYQSVHAFQSAGDAKVFASHSSGRWPVYEVTGEVAHIGDLELLGEVETLEELLEDVAPKYWEGVGSTHPAWEALLVPPVEVGKRLT